MITLYLNNNNSVTFIKFKKFEKAQNWLIFDEQLKKKNFKKQKQTA